MIFRSLKNWECSNKCGFLNLRQISPMLTNIWIARSIISPMLSYMWTVRSIFSLMLNHMWIVRSIFAPMFKAMLMSRRVAGVAGVAALPGVHNLHRCDHRAHDMKVFWAPDSNLENFEISQNSSNIDILVHNWTSEKNMFH